MTNACETLYLREPCGGVPNNVLPVLLYRHVLPEDADDAAVWFEQRFGQHQWPARWRYPVFTYTHFIPTRMKCSVSMRARRRSS